MSACGLKWFNILSKLIALISQGKCANVGGFYCKDRLYAIPLNVFEYHDLVKSFPFSLVYREVFHIQDIY